MPIQNRVLLVEGESDRLFFENVCKIIDLRTKICVSPPKNIGGDANTKGGVFNFLPVLLKQMADGTVKNLGVIIDADYADSGGMGCAGTLQRFSNLVQPHGFSRWNGITTSNGCLFRHNDGLADLGLWIMPNNHEDGMLEDWIKSVVSDSDQPLFDYAVKILADFPFEVKFKEIHRAKAEVATWMSWQRIPGQGPYQAITNELLDPSKQQFQLVVDWFRLVYP